MIKNLRVLFISHDSGRNGAPIGLLAFMRWLRNNTSWEIGTIIRAPGPLEPAFSELGPTLTLTASVLSRTRLGRKIVGRLPEKFSGNGRQIRRMFEEGRYDLVYSNTMMNGAVLKALASFGVPVVTHAHELGYWISRGGRENLGNVLARTTMFIAASGAVRDNLIQNHGIVPGKVRVVYEHIRELPSVPSIAERSSARHKLGIPSGAFVVGCCGAEHWRKGRDLIPQLLVSLRRQDPQTHFHFLWVGRPGSQEEEAALAFDLKSAGLSAVFHQTGEVADPFAYYPAMDVFALLSRDDPYPLACLEVAATETPVVCFAGAGGMPEFVLDGCGMVSSYLDVESIANDIIRLSQDSAAAREYGRRARAKVAAENTLEATAPQLIRLINRAVDR